MTNLADAPTLAGVTDLQEVVDALPRRDLTKGELRALAESDRRFEGELRRLEEKASRLARELFADLSPWQKVQLSRHPNRPYTLDYVGFLFDDFVELHGDRSFADDASIVASIINLAGALGLRVVAEGVEDEPTWRMLVEAGCEVAQGYFYARPMPGDELLSWLAHYRPIRLDR